MALGIMDLSVVTDALIALITDCRDRTPLKDVDGGPFHFQISGDSPETVRSQGGCQLSFYLFHVSEDKFQRNVFWAPQGQGIPGTPPVRFEPLSLDLSYLLTAHDSSDNGHVREQRAMSVAMRCLHNNSIVKPTNPLVVPFNLHEDLCVTLEVDSADEMGRLWQAFTAAYRMSAVYKVSVVLITPDEMPPPARDVVREGVMLDVVTADLVDPAATVTGTMRTVSFVGPGPGDAPEARSYTLSPATAAPGQTFTLLGTNLTVPGFDQIYLSNPLDPAFPEQNITGAWKVPPQKGDVWITLRVPDPAPPAGVYSLRVGSDPGGGRPPIRSNATPFSIAPAVTPGATPVIAGAGAPPTYTVTGKGFVAGHTDVVLGTVPLLAGGAPAPGTFSLAGNTIQFELPSDLPSGRYAVRVRVHDVEADPAVWIRK